LEEFGHYDTLFEPNTILILDDILTLNKDIEFIIKFGAHHYSLAAVFIVTQSCLSSPLYSLVGAVHQIILLCGNTATTRLIQHLVQTFFLCFETKKRLKSIFGLAEQQHDLVILKLNTIASHRLHSSILAITHVRHLFDSVPYCVVHPEIGHLETIKDKMPKNVSATVPIHEDFLNDSFVLIPASQVKRVQEGETSEMLCNDEKKQKWDRMSRLLEEEIESAFLSKRWIPAKNVAREILLCGDLCISENARTVSIGNKSKLYSVMDFLNVISRKAGPGEGPEKVAEFKPLIQVLLRHNMPHSYIINKLLLPGQSDRRQDKNIDKEYDRRHFKRRRRYFPY
jgi:hypothetical protein